MNHLIPDYPNSFVMIDTGNVKKIRLSEDQAELFIRFLCHFRQNRKGEIHNWKDLHTGMVCLTAY